MVATCIDARAFRDDVHDLGGSFRDANLDDRARTFRIEIHESGKSGRLIVRDLVFRERVRNVVGSSCDEVAHALALFMATALDESATTPKRSPRERPSDVLATPDDAPPLAASELVPTAVEPVKPHRLGGGGVVVSAYAAGLTSSTSAEGVRALAALRAGSGGTRIGFAMAIAQETRDSRLGIGNEGDFRDLSKGTSKRAGAFIGWGAPWNDRVVGFGAEAGVLGSSHRGESAVIGDLPECREPVVIIPCIGQASPASFSYISPYLTSQIVFQVPIHKLALRPIASIGALWVATGAHDRGYSAMTADVGLVWQAW